MYRTQFVSFLPLSGILFFLLFLFPAVPARSCTVSIITQDGRSLTVNQEDWGGPWAEWKPEQAALLFVPAANGDLSCVIVSWNGLSIEGGMNEAGLVYDFVAIDDSKKLLPPRGVKTYDGPLGELMLARCSSVDEAWKLLETYEEPLLGYGIMFLTDVAGNGAAILLGQNSWKHCKIPEARSALQLRGGPACGRRSSVGFERDELRTEHSRRDGSAGNRLLLH